MSEQEAGGGSTGQESSAQVPDFSGLLDKVSEIIDQKLEPVQAIVGESKNKSQRRNEELANQLKAEREKREALEAKLKDAGLADGGSVEQGLHTLKAQLDQLRSDYDANLEETREVTQRLNASESKLRRKELVDLVLGDVAPDAREDGLLMMEGYLNKNGIELNATQDLETLASSMRDRFLHRLSIQSPNDKGPAPSKRQPGAPVDPSKVNWDEFTHWEQIPKHLRHHVPQEVYARMATPTGGGKRGGDMNI